MTAAVPGRRDRFGVSGQGSPRRRARCGGPLPLLEKSDPEMTTIAVLAHSGKTLGGAGPSCGPSSRERGTRTSSGTRSPRAARFRGPRRRRSMPGPTSSSCGVATGPCNASSTPWRDRASRWRCCPPGQAEPARRNSGPARPCGRRRVGMHGDRRPLDAQGLGQRRALRCDGGRRPGRFHDQGRRQRAQGPCRSCRLHLDGAKALSHGRTRTRVKVDGSVVFKGKTSCVLVGNIQNVLGGITFFDPPAR